MKIVLAGDWHSDLHEEIAYKALVELKHDVIKFSWHNYFKNTSSNKNIFNLLLLKFKKAQNKFLVGPLINKINNDLYKKVVKEKPDFLFVYRGSHITAKTLKKIKRDVPEVVLVGYNNDDPFSKKYSFYVWKIFIKAIPYYDILYAYREKNILDFKNHGAKKALLLRSWFDPKKNFPVELTKESQDKYKCDVVFIGHHENDFREEYLEALLNEGIDLKVFGPDWNKIIKPNTKLWKFKNTVPLWGNDYNLALNGAKIALCFLSKLNLDTYTRRNFEIPATQTMMLSEYSKDLAENLFEPGEEADYFSSKKELIEKIKYYLANDKKRREVGLRGFNKAFSGKHDVFSRMSMVVEHVQLILKEK